MDVTRISVCGERLIGAIKFQKMFIGGVSIDEA